MSPGASLHTQMCTLCPQQAKLHLQRISQQHRGRPHMAQHQHPQQCRAGKGLDSRVCSCPAIHENFGAAKSCISCALFSSLCRQAGDHLSKRRAEGAMEQAGVAQQRFCAQLGFWEALGIHWEGALHTSWFYFISCFPSPSLWAVLTLGSATGAHGGPSWPVRLECFFLLYESPYLCILRLFILTGVHFLDWSEDKMEKPSPCLGRWLWAGVNQYPS